MLARLSIEHEALCLYLMFDPGRPLLSRITPASDGVGGAVIEVTIGEGSRAFYHGRISEEAGYCWVARTAVSHEKLEGVPRCCRQRLHLMFEDGRATTVLPPWYLMTWPHLHDCELYSSVEELMRECRQRKASAIANGAYPPPPPSYIQLRLTEDMRLELFGDRVAGSHVGPNIQE